MAVDLDLLITRMPSQVVRFRDLEPVLYDSKYCRKNNQSEMPVYVIYHDWCEGVEGETLRKHGLSYDVTVMPPSLLGEEYVKTIGHQHLRHEDRDCAEIFEVLEGEAHLLVQEQHEGRVDDLSLVVVKKGEKALIPPERGHVVINASSRNLFAGSLFSRTCADSCDEFVSNGGAALYVLTKGRLVKNPRYSWVPEVRVMRVETSPFLEREVSLVQELIRDPDKLRSAGLPVTL
jgi:glucose-6-phosphate isomerase